jgi:hypothetical protein
LKILILILSLSLSLFGQNYNRKDYGVWQVYDGCINVREQILIQTSKTPVKFTPDGCSIVSGWWELPFENAVETNPKNLDVDHTVPLSWADSHGAFKWDKKRKIAFANNIDDYGQLLPMSAKANRTKGDKGPDKWMPNFNKCNYIVLFKKIVDKNKLQLSDIENKKFEDIFKKECN